jgi:transposase
MSLSIGKKKIGNQIYYVARECKRVNGKPRITRQIYLGKPDKIIAAVQSSLSSSIPNEFVISDFGAVAALYDFAHALGLPDLIDQFVAKRDQGLSVGQYLLIAAINRCVEPKSKAQIADWFVKTPLSRLIPAKKSHLSSKRFWDNMQLLDAEAIEKIEMKITESLINHFGVDARCLLFDSTNFFTFIDSFNENAPLAQRGHSKEQRDNLRIVGLALLASIDFNIPLFHNTYPGNRPDCKEFNSVIERLVQRYQIFDKNLDGLTIVFDKGNNSEENFSHVDASPYHFVGSLKMSQCPEIIDFKNEWLTPLKHPNLSGVSSFRYPKNIFGGDRTVIVAYNAQLFLSQSQSLLSEIRKRTGHLNELSRKLGKRISGETKGGKNPTIECVSKQAKEILKGQYVKDVVKFQVIEKNGYPELNYQLDHDALQKIFNERLGKTILFTDNHSWTDEEIILAYRGQAGIENCFKTMKNPHFVSWSPMYHWTENSVRVHAFYCVIALILVSLIQRELHKNGVDLTIPALMHELQSIKEVAFCESGKSPKIALSKRSELQEKLFQILKLERYVN